jgi:hypothetical protein
MPPRAWILIANASRARLCFRLILIAPPRFLGVLRQELTSWPATDWPPASPPIPPPYRMTS